MPVSSDDKRVKSVLLPLLPLSGLFGSSLQESVPSVNIARGSMYKVVFFIETDRFTEEATRTFWVQK